MSTVLLGLPSPCTFSFTVPQWFYRFLEILKRLVLISENYQTLYGILEC